ncbi:MAG: hypothetical protein PHU85_10405 [Phycisphaerae bacterium]|nr:hypothetical protein [Phycisphaerae bacterium]
MLNITIADLISRVPDAMKPWVEKYGPPLLQYSDTELEGFLNLLVAGDTDAPLRAALAKMTPDELRASTDQVTAAAARHGADNADGVATQKESCKFAAGMVLTLIYSLL